MHPHINTLYNLANKSERFIIGLMSGTSLDGLDVALCKIKGQGTDTEVEMLEFETIDYDQQYKENVKRIFSKKQGDIEHLCLMNAWIGREHGRIVNECLGKWKRLPTDIDLVASHGQTIYHCPAEMHKQTNLPNATLQIGDGDHIAVITGIITVSDFRQKHVAAGGQGAPLVVYGDYLVCSSPEESRIMLNIGGIANFTYLPQGGSFTDTFSSDVGPGNTMMDAFVQANYEGLSYDHNSTLAKLGKVHPTLLTALKQHAFFEQSFPKTTGPELFNLDYLNQALLKADCVELCPEDVLATLNQFSADMIFAAIEQCANNLSEVKVYISGGGIHNPLLISNLQENSSDLSLLSTSILDISPDAKEAVLFALLANECVAAKHKTFGSEQLGAPNISMGKISFPD